MAGAIHNHSSNKLEKKNQQDPSKFYYHFLYKAVIVSIFLVILPLFPSQAPEFINQSLLTRNWELLHLLFVGIAISYGLFSRPNDESEKDNNTTFDNAHLVVSRFLHVSSFFEDESQSESESDEIQVQTWGVQYHRNEPKVVIASKHSNFEQQSATSSRIGEKPLLLPVRSLKSRVSSDPGGVVQSASPSSATSKSGSKRFSVSSNSNKVRYGGELERFESAKVEDKVKEDTVLPSPIPWRSSLLMDKETEFNKVEYRSLKSQKSLSSRPSSASSSPKGASSPSPSFSSESLAKNAEDLMRKKGFYKFSSPPPPPPPPPIFQKSISMKPKSSSFNKDASFDKELKRSSTSERRDLNRWTSGSRFTSRVDSEIEVIPKGHVENLSMKNSVTTLRSSGESKEGMKRSEKSQMEEEAEEYFVKEPTRKTYKHVSFRSDKLMGHASVPPVSEPASEEEKERFIDKVIVELDEDTETEDEEVEGRVIEKESGESSKMDGPCSSNGDEGVDVDKQADEFIAKFREQIRLQRIESIKRSARIAARNSTR
ncbi:nucleolar and coiled-body phosphoprotein 1-like [Abrus precatorius]|uniref:Nucleolar and coiled-body phosphoprotein 1-like n=1 Tax=Abrus precatorius TaxID=3816 RepID=A0A8B8M1J8_ABRPR|nr:nucleolar and coiled-body phosphoprotein 1-like [Abrus precatorius]